MGLKPVRHAVGTGRQLGILLQDHPVGLVAGNQSVKVGKGRAVTGKQLLRVRIKNGQAQLVRPEEISKVQIVQNAALLQFRVHELVGQCFLIFLQLRSA